MDNINVRIECSPGFLYNTSPMLIYGEAAVGKTLAALALASWTAARRGTRVILVSTEPQSSLPSASMLLPRDSLVYIAYSLEELADLLLDAVREAEPLDVIVVDTINGPYRVEVAEDLDVANRLLAFSAALLRRATERSIAVVAVAQVHVDPDTGVEEPPGYTLISPYFATRVHLIRRGWERVGLAEGGEVFKLLVNEGRVVIRCTQRSSSR